MLNLSTISAQTYGGGSGTSNDPYLISTAAHLNELSSNTNNGVNTMGVYYKMTDDITLGTWTPIGSSSSRFEGTFDGDGHSISGMNVQNTGGMLYGLFGFVNNDGVIRNVTIEANCIINAEMASGSIAGFCYGTIENCVNYATITSYSFSGGIVGGNYGVVRDCINYGTVSVFGNNGCCAGGIAGQNKRGFIERSGNHGNITATAFGAGGISGDADKSTILNCYNRGYVSAPSQVGGIVGTVTSAEGPVSIKNCYNASSVDGENSGAVFGSVLTLDITVEALYFDSQLCSVAVGISDYTFNVEEMTKTTDEMQSQDFIDNELGTGIGVDVWKLDTQNINGGYPVFNNGTVAITYTITANALPSNGGTVTGSGTYDEGENVTLTATANENYSFVNWTENGEEVSTEATYSFEATSDRTLVANFIYLTSVNEASAINVSVYPNPANDYISIEGNDIQDVTIYDISGRALKTVDFHNNVQSIDISDLNNGIYFMNIRTYEGSMIERIIKL